MQIYWINLDRRHDRRAFMERQFADLNLSAERLSAIEPASLAQTLPHAASNTIAVSELCVTASHRMAWARMLERGHAHALVLEDDACLSSLLPAFLTEAEALLADFDIVRIETGRRRVRVGPTTQRLKCGVALRRAHSDQWGTAGYIIGARCAGAMMDHPALFEMPLDHALFNPRSSAFRSLDWRQCEPGLCIQADRLHSRQPLADSDVTSERRSKRAKAGKTTSAGAKALREAARVRRQAVALVRDVRDFATGGILWRRIRYRP